MNSRPKITDKEVLESASHPVAKAVYFWQNNTRTITDEKELEQIRKDVLDVLDYYKDGYDLARELEDKFYESDSQLVEVMDDALHTLYTHHCDRVHQWVKDNNIQPKLKVGDSGNIKPKKGAEAIPGEILSVSPEGAMYVVYFKDLGHVKEGYGTHGLVLSYEYVEDQLG